jgi:hypothetical protein
MVSTLPAVLATLITFSAAVQRHVSEFASPTLKVAFPPLLINFRAAVAVTENVSGAGALLICHQYRVVSPRLLIAKRRNPILGDIRDRLIRGAVGETTFSALPLTATRRVPTRTSDGRVLASSPIYRGSQTEIAPSHSPLLNASPPLCRNGTASNLT